MRRLALLAVLAAFLAASHPGAAASLALGPRDREAAIRLGQRSVIAESFGGEWRVAHDSGESLTVMTPFHRLALAARHAAFRNEPLKLEDQDKMLAELQDRLLLWVNLHGPRQDFARHLRPALVAGDREIEPTLVQNEHTANRREDGTFLARCVYWFPLRHITGGESLVLVVRDPDGRAVTRFAFDLGTMR